MWQLKQTFAHLDLVQLAEMTADPLMERLSVDPWSSPTQALGEISFRKITPYSDIR